MDKPVFEKSISVCFSGHRKIPSDRTDNLCEKLDAAIEQLIKNGKSVFMAGGAIGFDTIAAEENSAFGADVTMRLSCKKSDTQALCYLVTKLTGARSNAVVTGEVERKSV